MQQNKTVIGWHCLVCAKDDCHFGRLSCSFTPGLCLQQIPPTAHIDCPTGHCYSDYALQINYSLN